MSYSLYIIFLAHDSCDKNHSCDKILTLKAKFHYASWFEARSKLVADRFKAKFHYAIWFEPSSNQLRTS